jgi:leucyl aminopeptidase
MNVRIAAKRIPSIRTQLLVCILDDQQQFLTGLPPGFMRLIGRFKRGVKQKTITQESIYSLPQKAKVKSLYIHSTALIPHYAPSERVKIITYKVLEYCRNLGIQNASFLLNTKAGGTIAPQVIEGTLLGSYEFTKYKSEQERRGKPPNVEIICRPEDRSGLQKELQKAQILATAVNGSRDIVNEPSDVIYPESLARVAREIARTTNLSATILDEVSLKKDGYTGLLAVGRGSVYPPRLIILRYDPPKTPSRHHLCLVGKGLTFDTGGVCLKPPKDMWQMKSDMAGAAAVMYTMQAIAQLKPQIKVTAIIPAAQNAIDAKAVLPGEIIKAKNGKTIHIENTDAEGRLVLTDAFARAAEEGATHLVDVATLTGSVVRALGTSISGIFGNDAELVQKIISLGREVGEDFWELPLYEEYKQHLKSDVADINNVSFSPNAGAIAAALFLQEFIPKDVSWIHLDVAGTAFAEKQWKYYKPGATGVCVKTLTELCLQFNSVAKTQ